MANDTIINTKNILVSLQEYALSHNLDSEELDFTLLGIQTYIKTCHMKSFVKFHEEYKKEYAQNSKLLNDHVRFIQIYKIKIHKKKESTLDLIYRLELGEFSTHPLLYISTDSVLPLTQVSPGEMLKLLFTQCNKIKAQNKMLVNQFSACLIKDLKAFVHKIYKNGFLNEASLLLFEGIDPVVSDPSKRINHYKKKGQKVYEVEAAELIITYIKPVYGDAGLNSMGQIISHGSTNNLAKLEYEIDTKNVNVQESKMQIKYFSKHKGFVSTLNNVLTISNKIILEDIKRVEATLTKNEENQVSIIVSQTDVTRDGIGEGVELVSESINITGHVGAKASIEAKDIVIDGATHISSFVTSKNAKINRHKGTLRCHKAEINSLEGGTVYATHVTINTALGGQVCAEHVTIKTLKHNLKIYASKSITIERILGEDNHFVIDYRKLPVIQSKLQFLNEELEDAKWKFEDAKKHSQEKLPELKEVLDKKETEIKEIKFSHYDAVITIMAPVDGLNTIEFAIPEKQTSLIYRTKVAQKFEPFSVQKEQEKITLQPVGISIDL